MISIDQNCHSLWDVIPKLHALAAQGHAVTQYVEDIDVAFTAMGASTHSGALRLERERFYRSGGEDWGAALFYSEFLGRLPVEIRHWESALGMKTDVLARQLGRSVDDLYDEFSLGDTWQLIGPSYVGDATHHRTIGDLHAEEVDDFLVQILGIAKEDVLRSFPQASSVAAASEWFAGQESHLRAWLQSGATRLTDIYELWLRRSVSHDSVGLGRASQLFRCQDGARAELLDLFVRDYDLLAGLYNQAVRESRLGLRALNTQDGELPFFGVYSHEGHAVRSAAFLRGRSVVIGDRDFALDGEGRLPLPAMSDAGIRALAGKAILLVLQVRLGPAGEALALPYQGSAYMPAAFGFQTLLRNRGLLTQPVKPVVRVRFHLLDRLRELETVIHLPPHLQRHFGREEVPGGELGNEWQALQSQARERLEKFGDESYHLQWLQRTMPELVEEIRRLDARRRELAAGNEKDPQLRELWKVVKPLKTRLLDAVLRQVADDWQAARIDYYDSRGAVWPWCVALDGPEFYRHVIQEAEIYEEQP